MKYMVYARDLRCPGLLKGPAKHAKLYFCNQIYNFSSQEHKPSPVVNWYTRLFPRSTLAAWTSDTPLHTLTLWYHNLLYLK